MATVSEAIEHGPRSPFRLPVAAWFQAVRRTGREFSYDTLSDRAAALTYYGVLSIFPAALVLVSVLGMLGPDTTDALLENLRQVAPGGTVDTVRNVLDDLQASRGAGLIAVAGLLGALWTASGYVSAFMRAANIVYDVPEGRPFLVTTAVRLLMAVCLTIAVVAGAVIVVFTGDLARDVGDALGLGQTAVTVWSIAKWPVLLLLMILIVSLLFWGSPNARPGGLRWIAPGGTLAVVIWLLASAGFAFYVANFGNYNRTYGTLAGVIVFLVWLWLTNLALLLGCELNAELARARAVAGGHYVADEPYVPLRDRRKVPETTNPALTPEQTPREEAAEVTGGAGAPAAPPAPGAGGVAADDGGRGGSRPAG
ncbi:YihY/virulence factor BrkB family protein [Allostreptomyces psammosilenae]|uniref:Membrane protein n=1 Tax=Allostreptomyces psammosilenae TaxID=1892865 RepID=A0A852ZLM7_9ACTN|nr:YihY/virulence factor BrkB family protein [Allostreptomyces psammosilenae]NYI03296.1 membrane protein [Allostreptomyces psammosilenae]